MLPFIIDCRADLGLFAVIALAAAGAIHWWLKRGGHGGLPKSGWIAVALVVVAATIAAEIAGSAARDRLRDRLEGIAPTYAQETVLLGHAGITFDTVDSDAAYLKIIDAQVRWERVNPSITDIYTFRGKSDGTIAFVVDSETDYDHDGHFAGDRESRTAIGEVYPEATPAMRQALAGIANFDATPITDRWGTTVSAYVPLRDAAGRVEAALGVDYDASLWCIDIEQDRVGALGFAGLLLAIVISSAAVLTVSRSELFKRLRLQRQLVDASRQAGMAEVATGVLHNVGNVLNSVNVSASVLAERLRDSKVAGLNRAADMIRQHRDHFGQFVTDDIKGRLLPDYLLKLADLLSAEQQALLGEVGSLARNLDHIKQVVTSQQTLAKSVVVIETFDLNDLIGDALRLGAPDACQQGVQIERRIEVSHLTADRHAVLQIMVNLVSNAVKAMSDSDEKRLTIAVASAVTDTEAGVRIDITDTGVGLSPDVQAKLFTHGFTTRPDGHGFGLHHSAIAAHNLRGSLTAMSDGVGRGATFTLVVPTSVSAKGPLCQTT